MNSVLALRSMRKTGGFERSLSCAKGNEGEDSAKRLYGWRLDTAMIDDQALEST